MPAKKSTAEQPKETEFHSKRLYRSEEDRVIAGVSGGLGEYFNLDSNLIRVVFVLITIFGGSGVLIYLVLWLILPSQSMVENRDNIKLNAEEVKSRAHEFAHGIRGSTHRDDARFWWGLLVMVLGFLFLFNNFGLYDFFHIASFWPLALVILGLAMLFR